jgi:hypothetical protein
MMKLYISYGFKAVTDYHWHLFDAVQLGKIDFWISGGWMDRLRSQIPHQYLGLASFIHII